jgi:integrase
MARSPNRKTGASQSGDVVVKKIKGVYFRNGTAYIRYLDQRGKLIRESTGQRSAKFAEDLLAKRRTEIAEGRYFPSRQFDRAPFEDLLNDWWERHGRNTRSRFEYHLPKIRDRFGSKRARDMSPDAIQEFLEELEREGYAASSINKYRTILCSTFNFAIRRNKYDHNPVSAVPQRREPPGRDRFLSPDDFRKLIAECESDPVLYAFVWIAATTGARKGEVLSRKWTQVYLEGSSPHIYIPRSKNGRAKRLPLAEEAITALKGLPSYGQDDFLFPADRASVRFTGRQDHIWDLRKPFQAACQRAGIKDLRIHDLRHMATTILFLEGVPEAIIRKLTGHRSRELERYEHLSPVLKRQTVNRIANVLKRSGTPTDTPNSEETDQSLEVIERNGGDDGARTRDLRRDRPAF